MNDAPEMNDFLEPEDAQEVDDSPVSIFSICETDSDAEENGRWFKDIFEDGSNIDVKLRRLSSKASVNVRRRIERQFKKHQKRNGEWPDDIMIKMVNMQIAEVIVVDWKNIIDRDGSKIACTKENVLTLMDRLPLLRDMILLFSTELDNYKVSATEQAEKN